MEYLSWIALGTGGVCLIATLIGAIISLTKKEGKVSLALLLTLSVGVFFLGVGAYLLVEQKGTSESLADASTQNETKFTNEGGNAEGQQIVTNSESKIQAQKVVNGYVTVEQKYPIVTGSEGLETYEDADGTFYNNTTVHTSDGTMLGITSGQAYVLTPIQNPSNDEYFYYQGYRYIKGDLSEFHEDVYKFKTNRHEVHRSSETTPVKKSEMYYGINMSEFEFIKQRMPVQNPNEQNLVNLPFLEGGWVAFGESILNGKELLLEINFASDMTLELSGGSFGSEYEDLLTTKHYKFEEIATNVYKLFLYPTVQDENGQIHFNEAEPLKRNFLIYVTSDDSFDFVYYDEKLKRKSIPLTRAGVG